MKRLVVTAVIAAFLVPGFVLAQTDTKKKTGPGQSEYAPGHQQSPAKDSAPGQQRKKKDDPRSPGASEYAPGQQGKTTPKTK
jgi:Ni/Co efflux regulator RcnB